jgi:hypothetical protein
MKKIKAFVFVYICKPYLDAFNDEGLIDCPCCGELLQKYDDCGYLHMIDGDADCYGALGTGKGIV